MTHWWTRRQRSSDFVSIVVEQPNTTPFPLKHYTERTMDRVLPVNHLPSWTRVVITIWDKTHHPNSWRRVTSDRQSEKDLLVHDSVLFRTPRKGPEDGVPKDGVTVSRHNQRSNKDRRSSPLKTTRDTSIADPSPSSQTVPKIKPETKRPYPVRGLSLPQI